MKPRISVVCVTNRPGSVAFLREQLDKQTFQDFEVIVADDGQNAKINLYKQFKPRPRNHGDVWNFCKAHNDALNIAEGELIVFLQDFIHIQANGLERFWEVYELYPDSLVTGVGHKAKDGLEGISEVDERAIGEPGLSEGSPEFYEINWASCPAKLLIPFNEEMDTVYAGCEKVWAKKISAPIWIDRSNKCIGLSQESCGGRPTDWEEKHFIKSKFNE
jgi:glycosyltransferase involved in cell wall biosynthesis